MNIISQLFIPSYIIAILNAPGRAHMNHNNNHDPVVVPKQQQQAVLYDFLKGHPNRDELPVEELVNLFQAVPHTSLRLALQYGQECGNPQLITELQSFIDRQCINDDNISGGIRSSTTSPYQNQTNQRSLFITEGVSHGIDLITTIASKPGDIVLTEYPTYFLIANIFRTHHLQVQTMPMKLLNDGSSSCCIDFDQLEYNFQLDEKNIPRMIYIIPSYHNPMGRSMSNIDRERITKLAYKYKILIIADEVYHLLDWNDNQSVHHQQQHTRSARMVLWNNIFQENNNNNDIRSDTTSLNQQPTTASSTNELYGCVSVSSFTKIFGPGVRCGWIEADEHIIHAIRNNIGYIQSQGAVAPVMSSIIATGLVNRTIDHVLQRLRDQYQTRCNILCDIMERESQLQLTCRPTGGYFIWIKFPNTMNTQHANDFYEYCLSRGVRYMPGTRCNSCPNNDDDNNIAIIPLHSYARLCFAKMNTIDLTKGGELFIDCFRSYMNTISN